jgi:hypothetical protein
MSAFWACQVCFGDQVHSPTEFCYNEVYAENTLDFFI